MMGSRILVVDDEPEVRSALRRGLESERHTVVETGSAAGLLERFREDPTIDLVTLDLALGRDDGLGLAGRLRAIRNVPIVMITARMTPMDRLTGLENGADDYIVKPFHIREVLLRIRSVLRRYALERAQAPETTPNDMETTRFAFEVGVLDVRRRSLRTTDGKLLALTDAEHDVLALLLRKSGCVMSRDDITLALKSRIWSPTDRSIDGVIARLRKKIEPQLDVPRLIRTVWGVGYVFVGDVQPLPRD